MSKKSKGPGLGCVVGVVFVLMMGIAIAIPAFFPRRCSCNLDSSARYIASGIEYSMVKQGTYHFEGKTYGKPCCGKGCPEKVENVPSGFSDDTLDPCCSYTVQRKNEDLFEIRVEGDLSCEVIQEEGMIMGVCREEGGGSWLPCNRRWLSEDD